MPEDCVFCKIAEGEIEGRKIYEDDKTVGLVDINPRFAWGQCVVFPKTHVRQFYQLEGEDFSSLFSAVKRIAKKIEEVFEPEFVSIFTRGQTLDHAHVIMFPAGGGQLIDEFIDLIISYEELKGKTTEEKLDEVQEKLKIH